MQPVMTPDDYIPFCDETINIYFVSFFPEALLVSVGSGVVGVTALIVVIVVACIGLVDVVGSWFRC